MIIFGFLNPMELFVILILVLLFFGPRKLPDIGRAFGEMLSGFKKGHEEDTNKDSSDDNK